MLTIIPFGCLTRMPSYLPLSFLHSHNSSPINFTLTLTFKPYSQTFSHSIYLSHSQSIFILASSMAISGFEGFEKRLELRFSGDDPMTFNLGLRRLDFESLEEVLTAVQCTVVSAMGNRYFDSYVLSESSLFVYPTKIIIKTCGTTQLLKSVPLLLSLAENMGFHVCGCRYTRGKFIFPKAQPFPHTSFREEVFYLEQNLPSNLCNRKACVLPRGKKKCTKGNSSSSSSHSWHVYTAFEHEYEQDDDHLFTMEVCMTELDRVLARKFFGRPGVVYSGDITGKEMTESTGIGKINPKALICDYGFDPCGYSMNSIDGNNYATIHVTPEDGYSYGSFECVGSSSNDVERIGDMMEKVVKIFRPGMMSVSITGGVVNRERLWKYVSDAVESFGLKCSSCTFDELPGAGTVVFQTFVTSSRRNKLSK